MEDSRSATIAVLLVDDQRFVGMAVERLLSAEPDITLHFCSAASQALTRAREVAPAIIFQDLEMPEIDGLTLVGSYRTDQETRATPIIVLSGNDDAESRSRSLAAGANEYMVKLPDRQTLVECIRKYARHDNAATARRETAEAALDPTVVAAVRELVADGEGDPMPALIDQFVTETTGLLARLTEGAAVGDVAALQAAGHSLKGSALLMGARRLGNLAAQVERDAIDGTLDSIVDRVAVMNDEWALVRAACLREKTQPRS